jgi:hypothetical protein
VLDTTNREDGDRSRFSNYQKNVFCPIFSLKKLLRNSRLCSGAVRYEALM